MKREYESPDFEVVFFDSEDIITANTGGGNGGSSASSSNSFSGNVFNFF